MAEAFRVDPEALCDVLERMAQFGQHAQTMLAEIDSLLTNLHVTWSGQGAAAHAEAHRRWAVGEAMMRQALAQLGTVGATAHANYTAVMAKNSSMWS